MGVYIKGMEMPTSCMLCSFCVEEADPANGEMCMVTGTLMPPCTRERLDNCPLVPVPPHGRLIDADALIEHLEFTMKHCTIEGHTAQRYREMIVELSIAPTIIPAEEGEG